MEDKHLKKLIERASVLVEALPYIRAFRDETVVIKYGGAAMVKEELKELIIKDIVLLSYVGMKPVIVHGGGPEISRLMEKMGIKPQFIEGHRVTDADTLAIAEMVLAGKLNGEIVSRINQEGGRAVGLSGKDGSLILAEKFSPAVKKGKQIGDIGFVGKVVKVNPQVLMVLDQSGFTPVISPIGIDSSGQTYNINADLVAAEIAIALKAQKLMILTDVKGILRQPEDETSLISSLTVQEARQMMAKGTISQGMIPKVEACLNALNKGVGKTHVLDGRLAHSLLLELFTDRGIGSQIIQE